MTIFDYVADVHDAVGLVRQSKVNEFIDMIRYSRDFGKKIMICGNGGSAALANHFAEDLAVVAVRDSKYPRLTKVLSLCSSVPLITCIANDSSYDDIFMEQIFMHGCDDDLLICISGSGYSENIVQAALATDYIHGPKMRLASLVGFDGGVLKKLTDDFGGVSVHIPSDNYGVIEDAHSIICHYTVEKLKND